MALQKRQTAAPTENLVSFKLDTFTGGAGIPEGDYLLKRHEITVFEYGGASAGITTLSLKVTAQEVKINGNKFELMGPDLEQNYSIGDPSKFGPSESGTAIVSLAGSTALGKGSNFFLYLENMIGSGFDESAYDNDVIVFDDLLVHISHITPPERANLPQSSVNPAQQQTNRAPRTQPVVSWIYKLPGEKTITNPRSGVKAAMAAATKGVAKAAAPAAAQEEAAGVEEGSPEEILQSLLTTVIGSQKSMLKTQARVAVFKAAQAQKLEASVRDAAMAIFADDDALGNVLGTIGAGFAIDGNNIISMG